MNIQFNRVELDGFMSFDRASLTIIDLGIVSVKGINEYEPLATSNGSGKSALSESILWCLTGSTSRGATDVANHILNKGVYVTLDMDIDDNNYVITRAKNHCDYGSALKIVRNGEDISGNTLTKSKAILEEEFNHSLDYDTLTSIIILSQGLPGRLSTLKPSSRKSRLEELSKTDHYIDALQTKVNSAIADLNQQFTSINGQVIQCTTRINTSNMSIGVNAQKINTIKEKASSLIDEATASQLESEIIPELSSEISQLSADIYQLTTQRNELETRGRDLSREFDSKKLANDNYMTQYQSYHSAVCPTCNQVIANQANLEALRSQLEKDMQANKSRLVEILNERNQIESEVIRLNGDISLKQEKLNNSQAELAAFQAQMNDYKSYSSSTTLLEEAIESDKKVISEETTRKSELEASIAGINESLAIANYFKNQLSRKFRSFLLEGVIEYMNHKSEEYSPYLFEKQGLVRLEIDGNNINIYLGNRRFEDLSGGEGRRVDIILQLIQRDLARNESGFSSNLLVLDEILDNLDATGADAVINLLEYKSPDINSLLIVSHKPDINIPSDSTLTVVKNSDQISRIMKSGE